MVRQRIWRRFHLRLLHLWSTAWAFRNVLDVLAYVPFNNFKLASGIGILDLDHVIHLQTKGRNIDLAAIHFHMAVTDQLASGCAGVRKTEMVANIIQARLQNLQHLFAGDATALQGALIDTAELALEQTIIIPQLLLLDQPETVIRVFAARFRAVNTGAVVAAFEIF